MKSIEEREEEGIRLTTRDPEIAERLIIERRRERLRERIAACPGHVAVTESEPRCFSHSVAKPPFTAENPAAHGAVWYVEQCLCGAVRDVLLNQRHFEFSPWRAPEA